MGLAEIADALEGREIVGTDCDDAEGLLVIFTDDGRKYTMRVVGGAEVENVMEGACF